MFLVKNGPKIKNVMKQVAVPAVAVQRHDRGIRKAFARTDVIRRVASRVGITVADQKTVAEDELLVAEGKRHGILAQSVSPQVAATPSHVGAIEAGLAALETAGVVDHASLPVFRRRVCVERAKAGEPKIDVIFEVNTNGLLTVTARDQVTGAQADVKLQHDRGRLTPEEIDRMCKEAEEMRAEDERAERENLAAMERGDDDM